MMGFHTIFLFASSVLGVSFCSLSVLILLKLKKPKKAMLSFQLKPDESYNDFLIFMTTEFLAFIGFVFYFFGFLGTIWLDIGRGVIMFSGVLPLIVFYRWWRRF